VWALRAIWEWAVKATGLQIAAERDHSEASDTTRASVKEEN